MNPAAHAPACAAGPARPAGLRALRLAAALLLAACGGATEPGGGNGGGGTTSLPPLLGADISALERIEQAGGVFRDGGVPRDAIAILRAHGATIFRLRLFVAPSGAEVQVNDLAYTVRMAQRVKAAGAKLLLDIHYSDTWADPAHQTTPAAWAAMPLDTLEAEVERYTDSVVTRLAQAGALPDIVQVGNEVDAGMLWPLGQLEYDVDSLASWDRFTRLLRAGVRGVRSATPAGSTVQVMVHYSRGADGGGVRWFLDHVVSAGVAFDLIGLSYYPFWHGAIGQLRATLRDAAQRYGRGVMVVETAYPWRAGGWESMVTDPGAMIWAASPQGQAGFLSDVVSAVADVPGGRGLGVLWWYPESIQVSGLFAWGGGSLALFDASGNLLPAAAAFEPGAP